MQQQQSRKEKVAKDSLQAFKLTVLIEKKKMVTKETIWKKSI